MNMLKYNPLRSRGMYFQRMMSPKLSRPWSIIKGLTRNSPSMRILTLRKPKKIKGILLIRF